MLKPVSGVPGERDARRERQSSWLSAQPRVRARLGGLSRALELGFAGFVLLHFSAQAYRAHSESALPEPGFERRPWLVGCVFVGLWLPFALLSVVRLSRPGTFVRWRALEGQARALSLFEPLALLAVVSFGSVHGALQAWPLLSGAVDGADLRAELVAGLSGTWRGVPVQGIVYLWAVGAAAFCAARCSLAQLLAPRPGLARAVIGLAVLAYLLGSYAVIRCGSGSLLP